jgi:hypothetical protein
MGGVEPQTDFESFFKIATGRPCNRYHTKLRLHLPAGGRHQIHIRDLTSESKISTSAIELQALIIGTLACVVGPKRS